MSPEKFKLYRWGSFGFMLWGSRGRHLIWLERGYTGLHLFVGRLHFSYFYKGES